MQEQVMGDEVKTFGRSKVVNISLKLTADNGKSRIVTKFRFSEVMLVGI
jgi:hypothetical protein